MDIIHITQPQLNTLNDIIDITEEPIINIQTIQKTNEKNKTFLDEEIQNITIISNDNKIYYHNNLWKCIPSVSILHYKDNPNNFSVNIPSPCNENFYENLTLKSLRIICHAYLVSSKRTRLETIEVLKSRMKLLRELPNYNLEEYTRLINELPLAGRGIKKMQKIRNRLPAVTIPQQTTTTETTSSTTTEGLYRPSYLNNPQPTRRVMMLSKFKEKIMNIYYKFKRVLKLTYFENLGPASNNLKICTNESDITTFEPLESFLVKDLFSFMEDDGIVYAFEIKSFLQILNKFENKNPYNRQPISKQVLSRFKTIQILYPLTHNGEKIYNFPVLTIRSIRSIRRVRIQQPRVQTRQNLFYIMNDEQVMIIQQPQEIGNNTIFNEFNNYSLIENNLLRNYLFHSQRVIRELCVELNIILSIIDIRIPEFVINNDLLNVYNRWGFIENGNNNGLCLLRILNKNKLNMIIRQLKHLMIRNNVNYVDLLMNRNLPRIPYDVNVDTLHSFLEDLIFMVKVIKRIIIFPEDFTEFNINVNYEDIALQRVKQIITNNLQQVNEIIEEDQIDRNLNELQEINQNLQQIQEVNREINQDLQVLHQESRN